LDNGYIDHTLFGLIILRVCHMYCNWNIIIFFWQFNLI